MLPCIVMLLCSCILNAPLIEDICSSISANVRDRGAAGLSQLPRLIFALPCKLSQGGYVQLLTGPMDIKLPCNKCLIMARRDLCRDHIAMFIRLWNNNMFFLNMIILIFTVITVPNH